MSLSQCLKDYVYVLIATAAEADKNYLLLGEIWRQDAGMIYRMGGLQSRYDPLGPAEEMEPLQGLPVGNS